ncbi:methyltransferase domain-containing protein [Chloroflexi bacterium TSY]|nr:methyltransferase domain-containing protein [Chloroflexi bacterium TSY]
MNTLIESWNQEEQRPFVGWDFSYLDGRMYEEQAPWSYTTRACELMPETSSLLDMGTAGGERLLHMKEHWPERVVVTEEYPPNIKLARNNLEPLGVQVVDVELREHGPMPFGDEEFGLILNRHSAFNVDEVARVLKRDGTFLTQQVHGMWAHDLLAAFGVTPQWPNATPAHYLPLLEAANLELVTVEDWSGELAFTDVGAIVYYLRAVPWMVVGFSVETHLDALMGLQSQLEKQGRLSFEAKKYLIEARKPIL